MKITSLKTTLSKFFPMKDFGTKKSDISYENLS